MRRMIKFKGKMLSVEEWRRLEAAEREKAKYDFTYQKGQRVPTSSKDPYDFLQ